MMECTICGGKLEFIGSLGQYEHFRCRGCGTTSNKRVSMDRRHWPEDDEFEDQEESDERVPGQVA